jgi:hypothetical protein
MREKALAWLQRRAEQRGRLEAVALEPLPFPPNPGEILLLEGDGRWPSLLHVPVIAYVWWLAASVGQGWLIVPLFLPFYVWFFVSSGRYWLTSERLMWKPRFGEPAEVLLSSLEDGEVSMGSSSTVKVRGSTSMTLRQVSDGARLAGLISIHRRPEFRDVARRDPPPLMVPLGVYRTLPGKTPNTDHGPEGLAVLRPGFVVYIPRAVDSEILDAITEPVGASRQPARRSRDRVKVPASLLMEQLQLLPEELIDALLRKAVRAHPELVLWEARQLEWTFLSSSVLELVRGDEALWAQLPFWGPPPHLERVLHAWRAS